jgi:hypothetical protein
MIQNNFFKNSGLSDSSQYAMERLAYRLKKIHRKVIEKQRKTYRKLNVSGFRYFETCILEIRHTGYVVKSLKNIPFMFLI